MVQAYLKAAGFHVQRYKVRQAVNEIDPIGTASRWSQSIKRRTYKVATPNSLWHMDEHLELSRYEYILLPWFLKTIVNTYFPVYRWGFVIHGCIDRYSRLIIYLKCKTSIQAEPVVTLFAEAVGSYGSVASTVRPVWL